MHNQEQPTMNKKMILSVENLNICVSEYLSNLTLSLRSIDSGFTSSGNFPWAIFNIKWTKNQRIAETPPGHTTRHDDPHVLSASLPLRVGAQR